MNFSKENIMPINSYTKLKKEIWKSKTFFH